MQDKKTTYTITSVESETFLGVNPVDLSQKEGETVKLLYGETVTIKGNKITFTGTDSKNYGGEFIKDGNKITINEPGKIIPVSDCMLEGETLTFKIGITGRFYLFVFK